MIYSIKVLLKFARVTETMDWSCCSVSHYCAQLKQNNHVSWIFYHVYPPILHFSENLKRSCWIVCTLYFQISIILMLDVVFTPIYFPEVIKEVCLNLLKHSTCQKKKKKKIRQLHILHHKHLGSMNTGFKMNSFLIIHGSLCSYRLHSHPV